MNKPTDFIFCPLCGASKWIKDPSAAISKDSKLIHNSCLACKNFSYSNITQLINHPILSNITQSKTFEISAKIPPFKIVVNYHHSYTTFYKDDKSILTVNSPVNFNWYKNKELIPKIKTYILFS
jgi:hypothetical protein